jgi:hypothetical protein
MRYHEPSTTVNRISESRQNCVEHIKNPSKSPFTKGDFLFPPFEKEEKGEFLENPEL